MVAQSGNELLEKTITARLTEGDHDRLRAAATEQGIQPKSLVRVAVIYYLNELEPKSSSVKAPAVA